MNWNSCWGHYVQGLWLQWMNIQKYRGWLSFVGSMVSLWEGISFKWQQGYQTTKYWTRLLPNRANLGLFFTSVVVNTIWFSAWVGRSEWPQKGQICCDFQIRFQFLVDLKKFDLSKLRPMWPTFGHNLAYMILRSDQKVARFVLYGYNLVHVCPSSRLSCCLLIKARHFM